MLELDMVDEYEMYTHGRKCEMQTFECMVMTLGVAVKKGIAR